MIKVIKNFNGRVCDEVIEVIDRVGRNYGKYPNLRWEVPYKGEWYTVFRLPAVYGDLAGSCISIKEEV